MRFRTRAVSFMLYAYPIFYTGGLVAAFWRMENISSTVVCNKCSEKESIHASK